MIEDYLAQIAILRPPMDRATVESILPPHVMRAVESSLGSVYLEFGRETERSHDKIDRSNTLEAIVFKRSFPLDHRWYGLSLGMTLPEATEALSGLASEKMPRFSPHLDEASVARLKNSPNLPDLKVFWGSAADGTNVRAVFRNDTLCTITLGAPGYRCFSEERDRVHAYTSKTAGLHRRALIDLSNLWRSIDDDDAMLMSWAAHYSSSEEEFLHELRLFSAWLLKASPEERHMAAKSWNWDYEIAPLLWIIRQPDCEFATALLVFFGAEPKTTDVVPGRRNALVETNSLELEMFDLRTEIRVRAARGSYTAKSIAYDFAHLANVHLGYPNNPDAAANLPAGFCGKQNGRKIEKSWWGRGLPPFNLS